MSYYGTEGDMVHSSLKKVSEKNFETLNNSIEDNTKVGLNSISHHF